MSEKQSSFAFQVPDHPRVVSVRPQLGIGLPVLMILGAFCFTSDLVEADQSDDFTYTDTGTTITITDYPESAVGEVIVPDMIAGKPVTVIGPLAFGLCAGVTSVTLPSGLTTIASQAFFNCTALTSVTIPGTVTTIGDSAFYSCIVLSSFTVPSGVTSIGNSTFDSCRGLTSLTLPSGITTIGNNAFYNCNSLPTLTIPSNVTSIGINAFAQCVSLTSLVIPSGVTAISTGTFADCTNLESVILPGNVTTIGGSAFGNCAKLTGLILPTTVTSIGSFAFTKCAALTGMVIPSGVPSIGASTFEYCSSLVSVTIPPSVTNIGNNAFRFCGSLTSIEITATTSTFIGTDVFGSCSSLTSITVNPTNPSFSSLAGVLFNKAQTTLVTYPRGLAGAYAVPSTVLTIGANAFRFSVGLTAIEIPSTVTTINSEAFAGCGALASISVNAGNPNFSSSGGVLFNKLATTLVACPGGLSGNLVVPSGVTSIGASAARYCALLTAVTIPAGVTNVGNLAFGSCSSLASATFAGNAPTSFGTNVFQSCAAGFKVFYHAGAINFTSPLWQTYPSEGIGVQDPMVAWLQSFNLPADSDITSDANADGVSLLMAYALDLNPNQNLAGSVPKPTLAEGQMHLSFHTGSAGVIYVVETCTNFTDWTTQGVALSAPDANQVRTATVNLTGGSRFMRLVAVY